MNDRSDRVEIDLNDWPRCAECDMPVEDFFGIETPDSLILTAICHNQTQRVEIKDDLWQNAKLENVSFQYAFTGETEDNNVCQEHLGGLDGTVKKYGSVHS